MGYQNDPTQPMRPIKMRKGRARQRVYRRQSGSATMIFRGCLALVALCTAGFLFFALILAPVMFRMLPYVDQGRIVRRVGFLSPWMYTETPAPTPLAYTLPTAEPARLSNGLALLDDTATPGVPTALLAPTVVGANPQRVISSPTSNPGAVTPVAVANNPTDPPPTPFPTPLPATPIPLPSAFHLTRYQWVPQTWNNCGPANLTQVLNSYGLAVVQEDVAAYLKPNKNDANVSPWQIVDYVNKFTRYRALTRMNGSLDLVKTLLVAKFRVIIETGLYAPKDKSWEGHYLTPIGYDDSLGILYNLDTLLGAGKDNQGVREEYTDLDTRWGHFNRVYIVVYDAQREAELASLLGPDADPTMNAQNALIRANQDRKLDPSNSFAWFNLGSSYVLLKDYRQAAAAYDQARSVGQGLPWRMNWYQFGMLSAYYHTGDYQSALDQIELALANQKNVEELYYWRGLIEDKQGNRSGAISDLTQAIILNPNYKPASEARVAINAGNQPLAFDQP
jgi:tetratricopeptide (TPR) repeat protein